jgi:hypothetical protein
MKVSSPTINLGGFSWLAAFWSYSVNHSILWAIFHFFCGGAYLAYRLVFHTGILNLLAR